MSDEELLAQRQDLVNEGKICQPTICSYPDPDEDCNCQLCGLPITSQTLALWKNFVPLSPEHKLVIERLLKIIPF